MKPTDTAAHYVLSSSPHAHAKTSVSDIMLDVVIALLPTTAAGVWFFGLPALTLIVTCVVTCVTTEALCRLAMRRENTLGDLSAVVTGLLLALNLPAGLPIHLAVIGSVFAIAVAKQVFGGLGMNPFNPALAARAFLLISFTGPMTTWLKPLLPGRFSLGPTCEAATMATPLATIKATFSATAAAATTSASPAAAPAVPPVPDLWNLLVGNMPGCIGEVSALALLLGFLYLLFRRVVTWHIPVAFVAAVLALSPVLGGPAPHVQLLTGGILLGAFFMATDYVTSPTTGLGKLIFGCGCGILCLLIRRFGSYPEGCSFAILIMNAICPLINRWTGPRPFGSRQPKAKKQ